MGTENQTQPTNTYLDHLQSSNSDQEVKKTSKRPELAKKCVCGCNVPILYAKRNCNNPFTTPRLNFRSILLSYFNEDLPQTIETENQAVDLYDLFHIILQVRRRFGRVSWRKVAKVLGQEKSTSEFRRPLRRFYKNKLKAFEAWLLEKGPVSIGCIDTSLVIIILKEFLPKIEKEKPDSPKSTFPSPSRVDIDKDIYEVMESLLGNVETGDVLVKKRKIREDLPEFSQNFEEEPVFIVNTVKEKKKIQELEEKRKKIEDKTKKFVQIFGNQEDKVELIKKKPIIPADPNEKPDNGLSLPKSNNGIKTIVNPGLANASESANLSGGVKINKTAGIKTAKSSSDPKDDKTIKTSGGVKSEVKNLDNKDKAKLNEFKNIEENSSKEESLIKKKEEALNESTKNKTESKLIDMPKFINPMTNEFRHRDPVSMGYRTDFRRGYLPIEMQEEHEKLEKVHQEKESKAHFIRKKQTAVNIKRSCGVTYVKPTESKQKGVTHEFPPLPPLAFQVGTIDRLILPEEKPKFFSLANDLIKDLFANGNLFRVTIQTDYNEEDLKNYILGKKPDGQEIFMNSLTDLWRILAKDAFVAIHLQSDSACLFRPCAPGQTGDCKVGILVKKGLCGTRSVKRCLGLPDLETDTLNMYATQLRLELYVTKPLWKKSLTDTKKLLCSFIGELEVFIQKYLVSWNEIRTEIFTKKSIPGTSTILKAASSCQCAAAPAACSPPLSLWEYSTSTRPTTAQSCPSCSLLLFESSPCFQVNLSSLLESKSAPNWFYLINTRDSFSYDLKVKKSYIYSGSTRITRKDYLFHKDDLPSNYKDWQSHLVGDYVKTGVVTFKNCFSHESLLDLEQEALKTEKDFLAGRFIKNTAQPTFGGKGKIKRTKFFFGTRYLWTSSQLAEKQSRIAAGVRVDVSTTPVWMKEKIEAPLVKAGVLEQGFINSIAMNIYHDGKEGLAQHFDDAVRFKQPIFTVKLDSDSRLSFGSQFYGYLNGAFCIPCPRGAVCMMEEFSYAANSAKHCVRPCDLAGRSITIILRQIHPFIMEEARRFDAEIDLPTWFSTLSLSDEATSYADQKEMETKYLTKGSTLPKAGY